MGTPTVTPLTENRHAGGYKVWDTSPGVLCEEQIVLLSGVGLCTAGLVLGKITEGAKTAAGAAATPAPAGATITASPTAALNTLVGVHRFECIVGGAAALSKWRHTDPNGKVIGIATAGTAYAGGGLSGLTITDSGTDPTAGEAFGVTVTTAAASGKWGPYDPTVLDGRQVAAGVLWSEYKDATSADKKATATTRGPCKIQINELLWGAAVTTDQHKSDALAALDLKGVRSV
jgi:hypothetical protein